MNDEPQTNAAPGDRSPIEKGDPGRAAFVGRGIRPLGCRLFRAGFGCGLEVHRGFAVGIDGDVVRHVTKSNRVVLLAIVITGLAGESRRVLACQQEADLVLIADDRV